MIVVDVNVIAYLWIPGDFSEFAERALERDPHWVSSLLWRSEFRNILAGYLRRGELNRREVERCLNGAESHLAGHEFLPASELVMEKVSTSTFSAYDCEYVALAEDLNATLVTSDREILREYPSSTTSLKAFAGSKRTSVRDKMMREWGKENAGSP